MEHTEHPDVVVVGAGLAGLSAALEARRAGRSVVVLDATAHPGGRARSDDRAGFTFNTGPHALYIGGPAWDALHDFGVAPRGVKASVSGHAILDDGLTPLPLTNRGGLTTRALSSRSKVELVRLMRHLPRLDAPAADGIAWSGWLDERLDHEDVRRLLLAVSRLTTFSNAPHLVSAGALLRQLQMATPNGVLYLHGGWQQLVDGLVDRARRAGATIVPATPATSVTSEGDGWLVRTADREIPARVVVLAAGGPRQATELAGLADGTFASAGPAARVAVLDVALPAEPARRFLLGLDEPTYFAVHGPPASLAPAGQAVASAAWYLAPDDTQPWEAHRDRLREVAELAGAAPALDERFFAHLVVTHGQPLAEHGGPAGRPPVGVPDRPGLFVAGDWVGTEGLLSDASFASGRAAGRAAAQAAQAAQAAGPLSAASTASKMLR